MWDSPLYSLALQPGLNVFVLLVEVVHVGHQIAHHIHMGQGIDLQWLRAGRIDLADACQGVGATNVHGT